MIDEFIDSNDSEMVINSSNAFQRKLIYDMLRIHYADKLFAFTKTLNNSKVCYFYFILIHKISHKFYIAYSYFVFNG